MAWVSYWLVSSLAGCAREGHLQDGCHGVLLSSRSGTSVPRRPSHLILLWRRFSASSTFANRHQLIVPRCRLNTYGRRAFSIAGPTVWNSLPDDLWHVVLTVLSSFLRQSCLVFTNMTSALEVFLNVMRYINPRFTYLLTYRHTKKVIS